MRLPFSSLRSRLLLLVFLAIVPAIAALLYFTSDYRRVAIDHVRESAVLLSRLASVREEGLIYGAHAIIDAAILLPEVRDGDPAACRTGLADFVRRYSPYLNNIIITNLNGDTICSVAPGDGSVNFADRPWFQRVLQARDFTVGEYQVGRITGKPRINFAHPILDENGQVKQVLSIAMDLNWLNELATAANLPAGSTFTVIDRNGTVLARQPDGERWIGQSLPGQPMVNAVLTRGEGEADVAGLDGVPRLFVFTAVEHATGDRDLYVSIGIPSAIAFAEADNTLKRDLTVLALFIVLAITAAWIGGDMFLVRPINGMLATTQKFANGDLSARTGRQGGRDELSQLAGAFDAMAQALQRRQTEAKQTERALRESEARYRTLIEGMDDSVHVKDAEGRYVTVNSTMARRLGVSKEDIIGKTALELHSELHSVEMAKKVMADDLRVLRLGITVESECEFGKGRETWFSQVRKVPLRNEAGEVIGLVSTGRDVTERKKMEEQVVRANRLEIAGRLAGQVAHDFNNLLSPLVGYPQMIKKRLPADHPAVRFCDRMLESAQQMAAINEDLLTLGRRGHFGQERVDLNLLVEHAVEQMPAQAGTLVVDLELASDLMPTKGSSAQLQRVLSNLISNAREAMQDIGIVEIKTENVYVDRPFGHYNRIESGEYVKLEVGDNGSGIPPDVIDRIFDPFFTTKRGNGQKGSGLGLSVVQAIVEDHQGYLDVESEIGKGSTFSIYLPISREALERQKSAEIHGGAESILVVDDDEMQRDVARELLETLGYRVEVAASGEEALVWLKEHHVDLLVLDMVMPGGIDGTDTYRRAREIRTAQQAIIVSGFAGSERVREVQRLGAGAYLRKPMSLERLASAVRGELDRAS